MIDDIVLNLVIYTLKFIYLLHEIKKKIYLKNKLFYIIKNQWINLTDYRNSKFKPLSIIIKRSESEKRNIIMKY